MCNWLYTVVAYIRIFVIKKAKKDKNVLYKKALAGIAALIILV